MSSHTHPYTQIDGSEDGDGQVPDPSLQMDGSPEASALRSGLSFGSNPLFAGDEEERVPKTLEGRDAEELSLYWASRVTDESACAMIIKLFQGMTGQRWVEMLTSSDAESAELLLKEDCEIKSRPERMMIRADAVSARGRMEAKCALTDQTEMRSRIMAESEAANAIMKARMEAKLTAMQAETKGKMLKMDAMPILPSPLAGETMLTPVQLERYKVAIKTYVNPYDTFQAKWAAGLIEDYKEDPTEYLDSLDKMERELDAKLGARLYDKSPMCIQDLLVDDSKRQHNGEESFIIMIKSIATRINFRCEARTVQMLNKYITKGEPCTDPTQLLSMVQEFKMTHGVYSRMCDLDCKALYKTALKHLLSAISKDTALNEFNIRLGISAVTNVDDFDKYVKELEDVALDMTLYCAEATAAPRRRPYTNPRYVNAVDRAEQMCMNKREGKPCRQGAKCPFMHDGFSGKICTDQDYLSTGICSKFNDGCVDKHPWNEAKHGLKADLMQKLGHKQQSAAKRAFLHSVNMVEEADLDLDMALRMSVMEATLGAAEVNTNQSEVSGDACGSCGDVDGLCSDGLCSGCCEMGGYECTPVDEDDYSPIYNADFRQPIVCAVDTDYLHWKAAAAEDDHSEYKQKLRQSPTPKVMHAVDRDAIMAVMADDCDDLETDSDCEDCSVTSSSSGEIMGHEAVHEEQDALDVDGSEPGTWNADDGSYDGSTDPESEGIEDDADGDGADAEAMSAEECNINQAQELITSITSQLKEQGWDEERIGAWMCADCDMLKAMKKMQAGVMAAYEIEIDDGKAPSVMVMFDGGTFAHMWGTDLMNSGCVTNLRKVPRVPCRTAKGIMWLDTKGDAVFNGMTLRGGFVNPNNSTSLISEGMLMMFESWDFHKNSNIGFTFTWPGLDKPKTAWRQGVLYYVPADMIPIREQSAVCSVNAVLPNDIDQSELDYTMALNQDLDEDYYEEAPDKPVCEQDRWMQMSAAEAFGAFTVANVDRAQSDDDMQMDCGMCDDLVLMFDGGTFEYGTGMGQCMLWDIASNEHQIRGVAGTIAGDMMMDCFVCEPMGQDFHRGLERPC